MSLNIKFVSNIEGAPQPYPAKLNIPEAYKKMQRSLNNDPKQGTVKRCVPFLDALTTGYIIPFSSDIHYCYDDKEQAASFVIPNTVLQIDERYHNVTQHNEMQIPKDLRHNKRTVEAIFKFANHWKIITPPGYSCIFTQPFNRNLPFKIIDGIVDTDQFPQRVHFPFYWINEPFNDFLIERNSPMVLVIPFKRESWKMEVTHIDDEEFFKKENTVSRNFFYEFVDVYKKKFWSKKEYR
jgi:hypothetical protein|tara:strand:- start:27 stop:740 length:714 start_codon:yes stop_codon:yes gene_type:complete